MRILDNDGSVGRHRMLDLFGGLMLIAKHMGQIDVAIPRSNWSPIADQLTGCAPQQCREMQEQCRAEPLPAQPYTGVAGERQRFQRQHDPAPQSGSAATKSIPLPEGCGVDPMRGHQQRHDADSNQQQRAYQRTPRIASILGAISRALYFGLHLPLRTLCPPLRARE